MKPITILNRCHRFQGFVYQYGRFSPDKMTIEVACGPRKGATALLLAMLPAHPATTNSLNGVLSSFPCGAFSSYFSTLCDA
jgi:hypothetical protein